MVNKELEIIQTEYSQQTLQIVKKSVLTMFQDTALLLETQDLAEQTILFLANF